MRLASTRSDRLTVVPDYHPLYGLDDSTRAEALCLVRVNGLPVKVAAARANVHSSTLYRWLSSTKGDI